MTGEPTWQDLSRSERSELSERAATDYYRSLVANPESIDAQRHQYLQGIISPWVSEKMQVPDYGSLPRDAVKPYLLEWGWARGALRDSSYGVALDVTVTLASFLSSESSYGYTDLMSKSLVQTPKWLDKSTTFLAAHRGAKDQALADDMNTYWHTTKDIQLGHRLQIITDPTSVGQSQTPLSKFHELYQFTPHFVNTLLGDDTTGYTPKDFSDYLSSIGLQPRSTRRFLSRNRRPDEMRIDPDHAKRTVAELCLLSEELESQIDALLVADSVAALAVYAAGMSQEAQKYGLPARLQKLQKTMDGLIAEDSDDKAEQLADMLPKLHAIYQDLEKRGGRGTPLFAWDAERIADWLAAKQITSQARDAIWAKTGVPRPAYRLPASVEATEDKPDTEPKSIEPSAEYLAELALAKEAERAKIDDLEKALQDLLADNTSLLEPFRMSKKRLKRDELSALTYPLITGWSDTNTGFTLTGLPDATAYKLTATIAGLRNLFDQSSIEATALSLEATLETETQIGKLYQEKLRALLELDASKNGTALDSLAENMTWLRENWSVLKLLIQQVLPANSQGLITNLESLFGDPTEQAEPNIIELPETLKVSEAELTDGDVIDLTDAATQAATMPDGLEFDTRLLGLASELHMIVFPKGEGKPSTREVLERDAEERLPKELVSQFERWRLGMLADLKDTLGGEVYRTDPDKFGEEFPWYIWHSGNAIQKGIAVVEHPLYGRATYIVRDDYKGYFEELVGLFRRNEARILGARKIDHPDMDVVNREQLHTQKILDHLQDLMTLV